jgi:hypothetical protein
VVSEASASSEVEYYLIKHGWRMVDQGVYGGTWQNEGSTGHVVVPFSLNRSMFEWPGVVGRIAEAQQRDPQQVESDLANMFADTTEFKVLADGPQGSINLDAGATLVTSAKALVRSSATTSRINRLHIGPSFSRVGDRIASQARMAHTRAGSYIVPVLIPLPRPEPAKVGQIPELDAHESQERRASRTLAQTLATISSRIIEPAVEPTMDVLPSLAVSGVSRESVIAVHRVVSSSTVTALSTSFSWAGGLRPPPGLPPSVHVPTEAAPLLVAAAKLMEGAKLRPGEEFTGVIVQLRHEQGESVGEFSLQTVRRGRSCEIAVPVSGQHLDRTHSWFRNGDALLVRGRVESRPGRPLRIPNPETVIPVAETRLFD